MTSSQCYDNTITSRVIKNVSLANNDVIKNVISVNIVIMQ